ncbi:MULTISPECIES: Crp/Fnr family transcriptional regulator [Burkholderia]|uniref:Crp/Fnr family transcriptional regulator n=1 Tax=Burkholderia theae TaxID=3143496 RepID=A0ABU9WUR1_9BURK|nr:Crp/Fnr family transcriptional regulator [Burkholderia sp. Z1]
MLTDKECAEIMQRMSEDSWFGSIDYPLRRAMLACCNLNRIGRRQVVFRQGDASNGFFGLVRGALKASTVSESGKEAVLTVLGPGIWFGEASSIDGMPRSHDVATITPAEFLVIKQSDFEKLMLEPGFAAAISRLQARRMRALYALLEDATLRSTRARIVRRLQLLAYGDANMSTIDRSVINITHDTLAMMLGISRQTLELELKELESGGAISLSYGRIDIISMVILKSMEQEKGGGC